MYRFLVVINLVLALSLAFILLTDKRSQDKSYSAKIAEQSALIEGVQHYYIIKDLTNAELQLDTSDKFEGIQSSEMLIIEKNAIFTCTTTGEDLEVEFDAIADCAQGRIVSINTAGGLIHLDKKLDTKYKTSRYPLLTGKVGVIIADDKLNFESYE